MAGITLMTPIISLISTKSVKRKEKVWGLISYLVDENITSEFPWNDFLNVLKYQEISLELDIKLFSKAAAVEIGRPFPIQDQGAYFKLTFLWQLFLLTTSGHCM